MFVRWLLQVFTALAVLAGSVTSYAASGMIGESECCCPNPDTCKCHDHDNDAAPDDELKRCGGAAERVAPQVSPAVLPSVVFELVARTIAVTVDVTMPRPDPRHVQVETPPF